VTGTEQAPAGLLGRARERAGALGAVLLVTAAGWGPDRLDQPRLAEQAGHPPANGP
jgi:hypothetical protein